MFDVPAHLQKNARTRKPPAFRKPQETPVTSPVPGSSSTEPCCAETAVSGDVSDEHPYLLPSPRKLKRRLDTVTSALEISKKRLKVTQQRNRRISKRLKSATDVINDLRKKDLLSLQAAENISASFSGPALELVTRCLQKKSGSSVQPYPTQLKSFALTLQFYSARAYDYVRTVFGNCLPHPRTLSTWYQCVNGNPGFSDDVFAALQARARSSDNGTLLCSFMMDEVAIRKQLDFDVSLDKFVGYVDMGVDLEDKAGLPLAHEALVFMIVSLTEHWKVPVAYFLIAGLQGSERANLVKVCIEKLYAVGVVVVSMTFDGCSANLNMASILGASLQMTDTRPHFEHPCNPDLKISIFLDACHMLKLIRNTLAEKSLLIDDSGNEIKWQYIKSLQELQAVEGLRAGNKLHERHIQWTKQKMKVRLAAQTLSSSVADSLEFCEKELKLPAFFGCSATVRFIRIIDRLFDTLNSRNPRARNYKAPLQCQNEHSWRPFLHEAIAYLKGLRLVDGQLLSASLRKTGVIGFVADALSAMFLFDSCVKENKFLRYLLTYKFSQDHLELFFAVLRSRGGHNNNPSPLQLKHTWKRLLMHNDVKNISSGNCTALDSCPLLRIRDNLDALQRDTDVDIDSISYLRQSDGLNVDVSFVDHDYLPAFNSLSKFVENVVVYIAGYVVRTLTRKIHCEPCRVALYSPDDACGAYFALVQQKDRGGLVKPSTDVIAVCKSAEHCIRQQTGQSQRPSCSNSRVSLNIICQTMCNLVQTSVFASLSDHGMETDPLANHQVQLMRSVAQCYVKLRLHHQCKSFTRIVQGENCRSVLGKTILFKGQ